MSAKQSMDAFLKRVMDKNSAEPEFLQAVEEVVRSVYPLILQNREYRKRNILGKLMVPRRSVEFSVVWENDKHVTHVNTGYRVQYNQALGVFKGGLRFHPSVNLSILKFLAFEQVFKNSLTGLWLGGAKGGSDFDPKGKSEYEVMRFCQIFMNELHRHIGEDIDVPAGDIGVGAREIGYLSGRYTELTGKNDGALTGKDPEYGGSYGRTEATGYGLIFFVEEMLKYNRNESLEGMRIAVSGSGNVAQYAAKKAVETGAKVVTLSDSSGTIYDKHGLDAKKLEWIMNLKNVRRGRIKEYAENFPEVEYYQGEKPWQTVACHIALPCATQNELDGEDAEFLISRKITLVAEGANMPTTPEAVKKLQKAGVLFGPGKAANAGGVAVSDLEIAQNSAHTRWSKKKVIRQLRFIMRHIHQQCAAYGQTKLGQLDYIQGANRAGFVRVANAMVKRGF